jgi:putative FmdB family regulatory protein
MPTYEYRCENGHDFEEFVLKISAAKSELPCPTCGTRGVRRVSAGAGLLFKGSGFYITDYGKDGKKSVGAKADGAKGDGASGGASPSAGAKADAKPAAPPATSKGGE